MYIFPVTCEMKELIVMLGSHCASKLEPTLSDGGLKGCNVLGIYVVQHLRNLGY